MVTPSLGGPPVVRRLDETLAALHPAQRLAVTHPARPLLLACGPGSGKTRILTHRIQRLIEHEGLDPTAILALTFSRAAADQPRGRLVTAGGRRARGPSVGPALRAGCGAVLVDEA